jgi:hypothetical protein
MRANVFTTALLFLALGTSLASTGCASRSSDSAGSDASAAPSGATTSAAPSLAPVAAASPATAAATAAAPALTDVSGVNGQAAIEQFAALGVVDPVSGEFHPGAPVLRRDFIRWLVKANNALWADTPAKLVKLADSTESSAFSDITLKDPDFPYIQGMQDAGYSVGFPDKTFRPDVALTREQMFAIKNVFDRGSVDPGLQKSLDFARNTAMPPWKDKQSISKTYVAAIATGANGGADSFGLVYGASSLFHPQAAVTRAQAAEALTVIGDHQFYSGGHRTLAQVPASPTPAPPTQTATP